MQKIIEGMIPVIFLKERNSFVAYSPVVDLTSCGVSLESAKKNFEEALEIFFEECVEMETLDKVLESLGWEKNRRNQWIPPVPVHEESIKLPDFASA